MEVKENNRLSIKLNEYFRENIKLSFVWQRSVIIVTNDDKVYEFERWGLKAIQYSMIIIGNDNEKIKSIIEEQMVKELCYKQLIDFKNSDFHIIARTSDGKVYCWGYNGMGCLGNGKCDLNVYKPELNQYLSEKQIIDICCGGYHTIVLTISGEVYSWGYNGWGQIGIGSDERAGLVPQQLNGFNEEKVKAISCGRWHSLAVTESGRVFSWGWNYSKQLGVSNTSIRKSNKPILIEMNEIIIEKISCGRYHNLLLSREGDIYVFGDNNWGQLGTGDIETQITPKKLNIKEKFTNISSHSHFNISIALSVNGLYYIWGECGEELITEPKETQFKSFEDIFEYYLEMNYRAIEKRVIAFNYHFVRNGKYVEDFELIEELGKGSYGQVFKVKQRYILKGHEGKFYAIKKIKFETAYEREFLNELQTSPIVHELDNQNVMKYYDLWLENDFNSQNGENYILYIQMELCDISLDNFIEEIKKDSNLYSNEMLTELGFYISSEIFVQILNGVNYLHKRNPQIIHRDLNPDNIMLKIEKYNKFIVKISDLGLAKLHELDKKHTKDRGSYKYMAPEVEKGGDYDTKADIYSLGLVLKELFFIDVNREYQNDCNISTKYHNLSELFDKMTQQRVFKRCQSIEEILNEKHLLVLNSQEFNPLNELERVLNQNNSEDSDNNDDSEDDDSDSESYIKYSGDEEHDVKSPKKKLKTI